MYNASLTKILKPNNYYQNIYILNELHDGYVPAQIVNRIQKLEDRFGPNVKMTANVPIVTMKTASPTPHIARDDACSGLSIKKTNIIIMTASPKNAATGV